MTIDIDTPPSTFPPESPPLIPPINKPAVRLCDGLNAVPYVQADGTVCNPRPDLCTLHDGTQIPLGQYTEGQGDGTTFWAINQCGPTPTTSSVATPPTPQQLPSTGAVTDGLVPLAAVVLGIGLLITRVTRRHG